MHNQIMKRPSSFLSLLLQYVILVLLATYLCHCHHGVVCVDAFLVGGGGGVGGVRIPSFSTTKRSTSSKPLRYRYQQSKPSMFVRPITKTTTSTTTTTPAAATILQASQCHPVVIVGNDYQTTVEATVGATLALATLEYLTTGGKTTPPSTDDVPPSAPPKPSPQLVTCMTMLPSSSSSSNFEQQQQMSNNEYYRTFLQDAIQYYPSSFMSQNHNTNNNNLFDFMTQYTQVISNGSNYNNNVMIQAPPMIHAILEPGFDVRPFLNPSFRNSLSSLGLHVTLPSPIGQEGNGKVSREISKEIGSMIQKFMDVTPNQDTMVTWDLKLHLSMLLSNSLPKSSSSQSSPSSTTTTTTTSAHNKDSFFIVEEGGGRQQQGTTTILAKYLYDYQKLGGTDPLLSQTKEYVLTSPPSPTATATPISQSCCSHVQAAAYSALRGNGLDAIQSSCIAVSIASILLDETNNKQNNGIVGGGLSPRLPPPSYNWSTIEQIVRYSQHVYNTMMIKEPSNNNSILRQKYKDYGYN